MRCLVCGWPIPRRWWQRGLLAPVPLCSHRVYRECRQRAGFPPVEVDHHR